METVELYLDVAGYCLARENHSIRGGKNKPTRFYALYALIRHPGRGWILFDTGYARRFYHATRHLPERLYRLATQVYVKDTDEVKNRLGRFGTGPSGIAHIIVSHFHADHIGGLKDFDRAVIHCSREAFHQALSSNRLGGITRGILKSLIPHDLEHRARFVEEEASPMADGFFGTTYDLFRDGSLIVVPLPGHAAGQVGLRVQTGQGAYFLVADACYSVQSVRSAIMPGRAARIITRSWREYRATLMKLQAFMMAHPDVTMVPSHCPETTRRLIRINPWKYGFQA
jgi:glyoxylase-like metal-dependent hydrolase (beta-lactamase superfamily II)